MKKQTLVFVIITALLISSCASGKTGAVVTDTPAPTEIPEVDDSYQWNEYLLVDEANPYYYPNHLGKYLGEAITTSPMSVGRETRWDLEMKVSNFQENVGESSTGILITSQCSNSEPGNLFFGYQNGNWQIGYAPRSDGSFTYWETIESPSVPEGHFQITISADGKSLHLTDGINPLVQENFVIPLFEGCDGLVLNSQIGPQTSLEISSLVIEQKREDISEVTNLPARLSSTPGEVEYIIHVSVDGDDANDGSPDHHLATIAQAQKIVRMINDDMTGPIKVIVHNGVHLIESPLEFTEADSGSNGYQISYEAPPGEKPVLSGGEDVYGWAQVADSSMWKVILPSGTENFRQLYVNGRRASRASLEKQLVGLRYATDEEGNPDGIIIPSYSLPEIASPTDLELHWVNEWKDMRLKVAGIEDNLDGTKTIRMLQPYYTQALDMGKDFWNPIPAYNASFSVENAFELISVPGEWFFDEPTRTLYYWPLENETLNTVKAVIPQHLSLIKIQGGGIGHEVHDLAFTGLTFAYTNWTRASEIGTYGWQAQVQLTGDHLEMTPAHIEVESAKNISLERNKFIHMGAAGLHLGNNTSDINIIGNLFYDISDTALIIGSWDNVDLETSTEIQPRSITVANNLIDKVGAEYRGAAGINAYYVEDVLITHNDLANLPYTGISLGWGWSAYPDSTTCNSNTISHNTITDIAQVARDAGGIYTLGQMPDTVIQGNVIRRMTGSYACLYPDEGSAYIEYMDNVCDSAPQWLHLWTSSIHDIQVKNTYTNVYHSENAGINITIDTLNQVSGQDWPEGSLTIMEEAGLEPNYAYLRLWLTELDG